MGPASRSAGPITAQFLARGNKRSRSTPTAPLGRIPGREGDSSSGDSYRIPGGMTGWEPSRRRDERDEQQPPDTLEVSTSGRTAPADVEDTADAEILGRILREVRRADEQRRANKSMGGKRSGRTRWSLDYIRWAAKTLRKRADSRDDPSDLEQRTAILAVRLDAT
ncbi:hypothetical protein KM043_018800 [Ampulex compressa]|nr:hypothetical protein KM043_018800 [Ampulex compressa]